MDTIIIGFAPSESILFGKFKIFVSQKLSSGRKLTIIKTKIAFQLILNYLLDEDNYIS